MLNFFDYDKDDDDEGIMIVMKLRAMAREKYNALNRRTDG
jgi:hypothetical protein